MSPRDWWRWGRLSVEVDSERLRRELEAHSPPRGGGRGRARGVAGGWLAAEAARVREQARAMTPIVTRSACECPRCGPQSAAGQDAAAGRVDNRGHQVVDGTVLPTSAAVQPYRGPGHTAR